MNADGCIHICTHTHSHTHIYTHNTHLASGLQQLPRFGINAARDSFYASHARTDLDLHLDIRPVCNCFTQHPGSNGMHTTHAMVYGVLEGRPKKSCGSWPGLVGASPSTCSNRPFHSMACFPLSHSGRMQVRNSAVSARKNWQPWSHAKDEVALSSAAMCAPSSAQIRRTDVRPPSALPWSKSTIVEPDGRRRLDGCCPCHAATHYCTFTALADMGGVF